MEIGIICLVNMGSNIALQAVEKWLMVVVIDRQKKE